jgi:hypothetical protein
MPVFLKTLLTTADNVICLRHRKQTMVYSYKGPMRVNMNYYIEKHDMTIILDALENLVLSMKNTESFGLPNRRPYSIEDVDGLFQSFNNGYKEDCK